MGSLENCHQAIVDRIQSGQLLLGVSKMAGTNPKSVVFSRFWTAFPFVATAGYVAFPWITESNFPIWIYLAGSPVVFTVSVLIRKNMGMKMARRLAMNDPLAFDRLWGEGALSLELPDFSDDCLSPNGDYKKFMSANFLMRQTTGGVAL
ncbi:MAG: hypothetical protein OXQ29_07895 [Rhodospirillaceae bacterium]|nr:hypothetical protein [Rhodospirillaceae bacterium]